MLTLDALQENYTKVSYKRVEQTTCEVAESKSSIDKRKVAIKLIRLGVAAATIYFFGFDGSVFASGMDSLDKKAEQFYFGTFIGIAKWVIIIKGGWDILNKLLKEDFDGAKRGVLQYGMAFVILLGLPKGLAEIENIFKGV
ncbi:hypothetical protein ACQKMN_17065 [Ureibacillus composti]